MMPQPPHHKEKQPRGLTDDTVDAAHDFIEHAEEDKERVRFALHPLPIMKPRVEAKILTHNEYRPPIRRAPRWDRTSRCWKRPRRQLKRPRKRPKPSFAGSDKLGV